MLLENKTAIVYGAGGCERIAEAFAREGASVFLAGPTRPKLERIAQAIHAKGGTARAQALDVLDRAAVDAFTETVFEDMGRIDVSFNLIGYGDTRKPFLELTPEDLVRPVADELRSHLFTAQAAVRHMTKRSSGVILALGGPVPNLGGFSIALATMGGLHQKWAADLAPYGIRVVTLQPTSLADIGEVAAFAASDHARTLTTTAIASPNARSWADFVHSAGEHH